MKLYPFIYKLHKWFSIIVGIQLLLWVLSGLYMTAVPISYVHGDHLRDKSIPEVMNFSSLPGEIRPVLTELGQTEVVDVRLFQRQGSAVYQVKTTATSMLIAADTGAVIANLEQPQAIEIAQQAYQGNGGVVSAVEITSYEEVPEIKGRKLPIWQVNFDDWVNTSLYVSNTEAKVITARSDIWRVFDFLWMLHIMDYDEREDFNNPLVIFMASAGIFMVLSGAVLLINGMQRRGISYFK